jgi:hypothetical protein
VRIHLVDTSNERGQYQTLIEEKYTATLFSYAYPLACNQYAPPMWDELVKLHLTETTAKLNGNFNIKSLLPEEQKRDHLFSYAYQNQEPQWSDAWHQTIAEHQDMNIHLAGLPSLNPAIQSEVLPQIESHLTTYAHKHEVEAKEKVWDMNIHLAGHSADREMEQKVKPESQNHLATFADKKEIDNTEYSVIDLRPRVIIDSGAFTAWTSGKPIDPRDYAKWALDFKDRWEHKMQALYFMNLDVIGDQDASWVNQSILEGLGLKPIPIITFGADKKHLIRALDNYDYIALGGLVPYTRQKEKLQKWLDFCFAIIMKKYKDSGVMPKIHLLGVTTDWVLKRYPCFSSDSSSWVSCLRFGGGAAAGIKQIPRYKESGGAMAATIHTLRSEIRKYKKMEEEATNLWTKRGIIFND